MCYDIKNLYLGTPISRYEYIKILIYILPDEIIIEYNLMNLAYKGYVYCEIQKGMYGLPQAGILSNNQLVQQLKTKGYKIESTYQAYGGTSGYQSQSHW